MGSVRIGILGASGDIGKETSKVLRGRGHETIDCYRTKEGEEGKQEQESRQTAYISTKTLEELTTSLEILLTESKVECVVNALGIGRSTLSSGNMPVPTEQLTTGEWEEIIYVNLKIPILVTDIAIKHGVKRVIHVGSALTSYGLHGTAMAQAYSASKKALYEYCHWRNKEIGEDAGIACIAPGLVKTKMTEGSGLRSLFKGELQAYAVAEWILDVVEQETIVNSVQLPMKAGN